MAFQSVGTDTQGRPALLAPPAATWWTLFVQLAAAALGIRIEIIQARGTYSGSAGTHADGWAVDIRTRDLTNAQITKLVALARAYGASATWYRTTVGTGPHIHLVIDAGATPTASSYQTAAVRAGFNGLGRNGRGGPDTHPKPATGWRTAAQGFPLMRDELERLDMPYTPDQLRDIVRGVVREEIEASWWRALAPGNKNPIVASSRTNNLLHQTLGAQAISGLVATVNRIAKKVGA